MPSRPFRPLPDREIHALTDEQILGYVVAARAAGETARAARALQILAFGYADIVRLRVMRKVPEHAVEDVAGAGILRAVAAALKPGAFKGASVGEFRSWLHTIVDRQVVDYWRAVGRSPDETPLPEEREGEENQWGAAGVAPDESAAVDVQAVIDQALDELGASHRATVELYLFGSRTAAEAATELGNGLTENNVHQIATRFRARVRELLDESS